MNLKETLAKQFNHKADIIRMIAVDHKLNLKVGDLYDNRGRAESWSDGGYFEVENYNTYTYVFYCDNVPCHKIDYDNDEVVETLDAHRKEKEVLVHPNTKMRIVSVAHDGDFEEMGYYQVDLELI